MSVALIGLIGIQVYWINNAVKLRQQKFHSSINEVLGDVVYQYEKLKTAESLAIKMDLREKQQRLIWQMDSINRAIRKTQDSLMFLQQSKNGPFDTPSTFQQSNNVVFSPKDNGFVEMMVDAGNQQFEISVYEEFLIDSAGVMVKRSREKHFESPNYGPIRKPVLPESETETAYYLDSLKQAQTMNLHWLEKRADMVNEIFEEIVNVDLYDRADKIDTIALDSLLKQQLKDKGIGADYAYGIFDPFMNAYHLQAEKEDVEGVLTSPHKVSLSAGNVFSQP